MVKFTRTTDEAGDIATDILVKFDPSYRDNLPYITRVGVVDFLLNGDTDYCDICHKTGTLFKFIPPAQVITDTCLCKMALTSRKNIEAKLAASGIPSKYQSFKLDDWQNPGRTDNEKQANQKSLDGIRAYVRKLPLLVSKGYGLFLCGPHGVGKTLLACAIGSEAIKQGISVRFEPLSSIIALTVQGWYDQEKRDQLRQYVEEIDLLIIDDCDKISYQRGESNIVVFDTMFRKRVQNSKPIIFTSNHTVGDAEQTFNSSVRSLFLEQSAELTIVGEDFRKKINAQIRKEILG